MHFAVSTNPCCWFQWCIDVDVPNAPSGRVYIHTCVRGCRLQSIACFCRYNPVHPVWVVPFSLTRTLHHLVTNRNVNYKECQSNTHTQKDRVRLNTDTFMNGKSLTHIPFINPPEPTWIVCLNKLSLGCTEGQIQQTTELWIQCCSLGRLHFSS